MTKLMKVLSKKLEVHSDYLARLCLPRTVNLLRDLASLKEMRVRTLVRRKKLSLNIIHMCACLDQAQQELSSTKIGNELRTSNRYQMQSVSMMYRSRLTANFHCKSKSVNHCFQSQAHLHSYLNWPITIQL